MTVSILGGLGLFLLGMGVMTEGLRALAGSALRAVLTRAASRPIRGAFWGAVATLLVQSSSATTMTTIGLVSAGLLSFPQALGVVLGANVGTTGTSWLVALLGVKVSLTPAALPTIFVGALLRLLGKRRWHGAGGTVAGLGLVLLGLTVLQDGMGGLAARMSPGDLPALDDGFPALVLLALAGVAMTTVMQSSSAAIATTLSALSAGALHTDQAAVLIVGQSVGSAVSSALAAIGATTPAKRTALAHVVFNILLGAAALSTFPLYRGWIVSLSSSVDPPTLMAAFHTTLKVVGVGLVLPVVRPFARLVEAMIPQRGLSSTQHLDRSVLAVPSVAVEAARRSIGSTLESLCSSITVGVAQTSRGEPARSYGAARAARAVEALREIRAFLSDLAHPPSSESERQRLSDTLHALDHTTRLAENVLERSERGLAGDTPTSASARAASMTTEVLTLAGSVADRVAAGADAPETRPLSQTVAEIVVRGAALAEFRRGHRSDVLDRSSRGELSPEVAITSDQDVRWFDRIAFHAQRAAMHLAGARLPEEAADTAASPGAAKPSE